MIAPSETPFVPEANRYATGSDDVIAFAPPSDSLETKASAVMTYVPGFNPVTV